MKKSCVAQENPHYAPRLTLMFLLATRAKAYFATIGGGGLSTWGRLWATRRAPWPHEWLPRPHGRFSAFGLRDARKMRHVGNARKKDRNAPQTERPRGKPWATRRVLWPHEQLQRPHDGQLPRPHDRLLLRQNGCGQPDGSLSRKLGCYRVILGPYRETKGCYREILACYREMLGCYREILGCYRESWAAIE